jgi:hypothetical protein
MQHSNSLNIVMANLQVRLSLEELHKFIGITISSSWEKQAFESRMNLQIWQEFV